MTDIDQLVIDPDPPAAASRRLLVACLGEAALIGVAWLAAWLFDVPLGRLINPAGRQAQAVLIGLAATLPMVGFLVWMLRSRWAPIARLRDQARGLVGALLAGASPGIILLLAILAGVGEEMLFRGALQPLLGRWLLPIFGEDYAAWGGVLAASLLFGLAHPISRAYVVVATIGGLYLGVLAQLTGEALSAIVAHAAYDIVALFWLRIEQAIGYEPAEGSSSETGAPEDSAG